MIDEGQHAVDNAVERRLTRWLRLTVVAMFVVLAVAVSLGARSVESAAVRASQPVSAPGAMSSEPRRAPVAPSGGSANGATGKVTLLVPAGGVEIAKGAAGARQWAVSASERERKPTLELRVDDGYVLGKSGDFAVARGSHLDFISTLVGDRQIVFGVVSPDVARLELELTTGDRLTVTPTSPSALGPWSLNTFVAELSSDIELKSVLFFDQNGLLLGSEQPHGRGTR